MTTPEESYRALVQRYIRAGKLSAEDQEALEIDRALLGLLPATARSIEQAVAAQAVVEQAISPVVSAPQPAVNSPPVLIPVIPVIEPSEPSLAVLPKLDDAGTAAQPQRTADYLAHRQQYKQELVQALQKDGPLLSDEAFAQLKKLEEQFNLSFDDVAQIYEEVMQEITTGKPLPAPRQILSSEAEETSAMESLETQLSEAQSSEAQLSEDKPEEKAEEATAAKAETTESAEPQFAYASAFAGLFERLEKNLEAGHLKTADQITREILIELIDSKLDWINQAALQAFNPSPLDKAAIRTLDHFWLKHTSMGGFGRQRQIFGEVPPENLDNRQNDNRLQVLEFSREVGWWTEGLEFFKLYDQLDFTTQAPRGHLPALWFWKRIPRVEAFRYGNFGLLEERGGCRIEGYILPTFMRLLERCGVEAV